MSSKVGDYGSVERQPELAREESYDIDNTYYVKESSLTPSERRQKILQLVLPILIAFLIMGAAGFFLFSDFNHLYPGSGRGKDDGDVIRPARNYSPLPSGNQPTGGGATPADKGYTVPPPIRTPDEDKGETKKKSPPLATCADNEGCHQLHLTGMCCPTSNGIFLGCCNA